MKLEDVGFFFMEWGLLLLATALWIWVIFVLSPWFLGMFPLILGAYLFLIGATKEDLQK